MVIEQFIDAKISQIEIYLKSVLNKNLHYTELDLFINDTLGEWSLLSVTDDIPHNTKERVFWHLIHEISLHGAQALHHDLYFKSEINTCLDFFAGIGSYPIDCIGWRPLP